VQLRREKRLSSLTILRTPSYQWKVHPPFPNWKELSHIDGFLKFQGEILPGRRRLFNQLATGQTPRAQGPQELGFEQLNEGTGLHSCD
jgi:hypothetical protein